MRLLLVGAGATYSTADVERGYLRALRAAGHQVAHYALAGRIAAAGGYLRHVYRQARRAAVAQGTEPPDKPTEADALYLAGQGILERALRFCVDAVLIVSGMYVLPDTLELLRRAGLRVALLLTESPYDDDAQARLAALADVCFTNERTSVPFLRRACPRTHYLPHAYDPALHTPTVEIADGVPAHDVVFVGTGFQERIETLAAVDWTGIDLGLYGSWDLLGARHRLRRFVRGKVLPNAEAVGLYKTAKITLNLYRTSRGFGRHAPRVEHAESLNPRAVELAACGAFQVSDERAEVRETFGALVPTFRDPAHLRGLVERWLADEDGRAAVQAQLPACVAGRTYGAMAEQMTGHLQDARCTEEAA